jgi:hypothetical protein
VPSRRKSGGLEDVLPKLSRFVALLVLAVPGVAQAQPVRLIAGYEIEWQGVQVGAFETELVTEPERYHVTYKARTAGFLGWLFPFASQGSSAGARAAAQAWPERYQGGSQYRDRSSSWVVTFDAEGRVIEVELPEQDESDREPVPAALQIAPDPLALALRAIGVAAPGAQFSGTSFDGKRALRFELACAHDLVPFADAPPGAAVAVEQEALACTIEGELAAGASRRWKDRGMRDEDREPVAVWLNRGIVEDSFWPVRVEAPTRYGTVTARLVSLGASAADAPSN